MIRPSKPKPVPWSQIHSWDCDACGECCRWFDVPVTIHEYVKICQAHGLGFIYFRRGEAWLKLQVGKRCIFSAPRNGRWLCSLQEEKPLACRNWPFRVTKQPISASSDAAKYECGEWSCYVYADPRCPTIVHGKPTPDFADKVVGEFIQIALGKTNHQNYSTARGLAYLNIQKSPNPKTTTAHQSLSIWVRSQTLL